MPLKKDLALGEVISRHHFIVNQQSQNVKTLLQYKAGIPVRYRDMSTLFDKFKLSFHEIHLSCNDLDFNDFPSIPLLKDCRSIGFHAPDIYDNNLIFDPTTSDEEISSGSICSFERFCGMCFLLSRNLILKVQSI